MRRENEWLRAEVAYLGKLRAVKHGWTAATKTVLKLMRSLGLVCKVRRKKRYNAYQGGQGRAAPNVLNREFEADAPNRKGVTDVTEFSVGDRKLYLSPVMDLFDRQWGDISGVRTTADIGA